MVYSHTSYTTHDLARHIKTDAGLHSYTYNPEGLGIFKQYSPTNKDDLKLTEYFLEQEGDLDIYHAKARMYDPAIGRFYGVDAMRGLYLTINSYHYTLNNPVGNGFTSVIDSMQEHAQSLGGKTQEIFNQLIEIVRDNKKAINEFLEEHDD